MAWLLDTNVWIHYLKDRQSPVRLHLEQHTPRAGHRCVLAGTC